VADEPIEADKKTPLLSGWMIVVLVAVVAVAALGITALVTRTSTSSGTTTTTKVPARTTTTIAPTTTTVPVTTTTVAPTTTTAMIDKITAGVYGPVVWQTGDPLGSNPGPYYCCFPPPPGSPLGMDYSGSHGCSGGADQNGNLVGGYWLNGKDC
jgi:hypothetical protein